VDDDPESAAEVLEKTGPIKLLESRRSALIGWMRSAQTEIKDAEDAIERLKRQTIEMIAEIDEIEIALNDLNKANTLRSPKSADGEGDHGGQ